MSASTTIPAAEVLPPASAIGGLEPIERVRRRWPIFFAGAVTLLMVFGLGRELFGEGLGALTRDIPRSPGYYLTFLILYMSSPVFDWLIFRKLWKLPIEGLAALMRKRIANDVVIGYSGDAYFYAWARERLKMVAAPFGAVKDVSILSAIAGNGMTLGMMAIALPFAKDLLTDAQFKTVAGSAAVTLAMSLPFLIFSRRVFSLPRSSLWWIFGMHCLRILTGSFLVALAWHLAMPDVSLGMWLFLSAGRLLVSRLPLVPNKDLLFANFAIILIGQGEQLSELMAFSAALILLTHIVFIAGFGVAALVRRIRA